MYKELKTYLLWQVAEKYATNLFKGPQKMSSSTETNGGSFFGFLKLGGAIVVLYIGVQVIMGVWNIIKRATEFITKLVGDAVSIAEALGIAITLLVIGAIIVALLLDATQPLVMSIKRKYRRVKSIRSCKYPLLCTFQGYQSESELDKYLSSKLRQTYLREYSRYPDFSTFAGARDQWAAFRRDMLPKELVGYLRGEIERDLFSPLYDAHNGDNTEVQTWLNKHLQTVRKPHQIRHTLLLVNLCTFGKFGLSEKVWKELDIEQAGTDQEVVNSLLWECYWPSITTIEKLVSYDLELDEQPVIELPAAELEEPQEEGRGPLMLPEPAVVASMEPEPYEESEEEKEQERAREEAHRRQQEAIELVDSVHAYFAGDNEDLKEPEGLQELFGDMEVALLEKAAPFHPDPEAVQLELQKVQKAHDAAKSFGVAFTEATKEEYPSEPWVQEALAAMSTEAMDGTSYNSFRNRCLKNYINKSLILT